MMERRKKQKRKESNLVERENDLFWFCVLYRDIFVSFFSYHRHSHRSNLLFICKVFLFSFFWSVSYFACLARALELHFSQHDRGK